MPEKKLNETEASHLLENEFKIMITRVLKQLNENCKQLTENYKKLHENNTSMKKVVEIRNKKQ